MLQRVKMKVSIITATYNSQEYLKQTIESVNSQKYKNIEHIIVDGGSTDSTLDIINKNPNKNTLSISEKDQSMYDAINKGIKMASGEVIGVLNSDDFLVSNTVIENIVNNFTADGSCDGVYGNIIKIKNNSKYIRKGIQASFIGLLSFGRGSIVPHPTLYIKKNIHEKINGYDLSYLYASDLDYILKVLSVTKLKYIDLNITSFRIHDNSITSSGKIKNERTMVIDKYLKNTSVKLHLKFIYNLIFIMKNIDALKSKIRSKFER